MKVRFTVAHLKRNLDDWIKSVDLLSKVIARGVKCQTVIARTKSFVFGQQLGQRPSPSVREENIRRHSPPDSCRSSRTGTSFAGLPLSCVQNMGGNSIHEESHFFSRRCAICRCCSAASRSSVASSFDKRRRRISRICGADLPVAQTMKMRLNFCSYSRLPAARADLTSSPAAPTLCCSALDQAADWAGAEIGACASPIRG